MNRNHHSSRRFSLRARTESFGFAFQGIFYFFKTEANAWLHLTAAVIVIIAGSILKINITEWIALIFCITLVMVSEMLNTALEKLCDTVHPDKHPLIKAAKDIAAAAVLVTAIASILIAGIIFLPKTIIS